VTSTPMRTRFHEAGHAVIGVRGGWHCTSILVAGLGDAYHGACGFGLLKYPPIIDGPVRGELRERVVSRTRLKVAGEVAAVKVTGERWDVGCWADYHGSVGDPGALDLAGWLLGTDDPARISEAVAEVEAQVAREFEDPTVWAIVEDLAATLETTPQMLGGQVAAFFSRYGIPMPALEV
jgi:hypothetical protein